MYVKQKHSHRRYNCFFLDSAAYITPVYHCGEGTFPAEITYNNGQTVSNELKLKEITVELIVFILPYLTCSICDVRYNEYKGNC